MLKDLDYVAYARIAQLRPLAVVDYDCILVVQRLQAAFEQIDRRGQSATHGDGGAPRVTLQVSPADGHHALSCPKVTCGFKRPVRPLGAGPIPKRIKKSGRPAADKGSSEWNCSSNC